MTEQAAHALAAQLGPDYEVRETVPPKGDVTPFYVCMSRAKQPEVKQLELA